MFSFTPEQDKIIEVFFIHIYRFKTNNVHPQIYRLWFIRSISIRDMYTLLYTHSLSAYGTNKIMYK